MKLFQRTAKDSADLPELVPAEKPVRGSPPRSTSNHCCHRSSLPWAA